MLITDNIEAVGACLPALGDREHLRAPDSPVSPAWAEFDQRYWDALCTGVDCQLRMIASDPFWQRYYVLADAAVSQYAALRQVANTCGGVPGPLVCLALAGRNFQGQQGRVWQAARGNLHLVLGLHCDLPATAFGPVLPMLPAVAVMDAVRPWLKVAPTHPPCGIKWVNDIMCGANKLAGVLTSIRTTDGRVTDLVLGIGLNVAVAPDILPTVFVPGTTCLQDLTPGMTPGLEAMMSAVLDAVQARWRELVDLGPGNLIAAYRADSLVVGREVGIWPVGTEAEDRLDAMPEPLYRGKVAAIGPALEIILEGRGEPITAGRLAIAPW